MPCLLTSIRRVQLNSAYPRDSSTFTLAGDRNLHYWELGSIAGRLFTNRYSWFTRVDSRFGATDIRTKNVKNDLRMNKIGRNDPCFCGSGKKYKHCHGTPNVALKKPSKADILKIVAESQAKNRQLQDQQGLGKPIISATLQGQKFVAVGSNLFKSNRWKTFHDFLVSYIQSILTPEWANPELKKPFDDRHPILQWHETVVKYMNKRIKEPGKVYTADMTGAIAAYLSLAYNLYLLAHNEKIQNVLVNRLRNKEQFSGAYYETIVAGFFIKSGFSLELEDESDVTHTHCEFTATYIETKKKFSVEAKSRSPGKKHADVGNQLHEALKKEANHTRVVFIDINLPDEITDENNLSFFNETLNGLRGREDKMKIDGIPAPPAYVFLTNHPYQYYLDTPNFKTPILAEGFKIPSFKLKSHFTNLKEALIAEKEHYEMFKLIDSMGQHGNIPSTFEGEIPEFEYGDTPLRLKIGEKYLIPYENKEVEAELIDALVLESEKLVYGIYKLENGYNVICSCPMSDEELRAYKRHPETFFGIIKEKPKNIKDPVELFHRVYNNYKHTPKYKLLEFMKDHSDIETLRSQTQEKLAFLYCERLVYYIMR